MMWRNEHSTIKGLAAGAIGGLVASWIMGYVHSALGGGAEEPRRDRRESSQAGEQQHQKHRRQQQGGGEDATVKTAVAISEGVFDHELEPEEKKAAGSLVHYAFGTIMGGLYGMAAEEWGPASWGEGTLFGAALWFGSDEIAVPALKLMRPPQDYPLKVHAGALASHLVYGFTTEMVRRALRAGVLSR